MDINKRIELTRIGNILIYFSKNTKYCGVTKVNKLIYYLDCYHLLKYGRTVTRDKYYKLPEGPVPMDIYRRLTSIREMIWQEDGLSKDIVENFDEYLFAYIKISVEKIAEGINLFKIVPRKYFQPKWFSLSERKIMLEIASKYKFTTAKTLIEMTHKELPYIKADNSEEMDIKLFLKEKGLSPEKITEVTDIEDTIKSMEVNYHCKPHGIMQLN